jgi:hypothetical protein
MYTALSYTWGAPNKTYVIEVNGRKLKVRDNLYIALKYIRDAKKLLRPLAGTIIMAPKC